MDIAVQRTIDSRAIGLQLVGQFAQPARRLFTAAEARLAIGPQVIAHAINLTPQRARTSLNKARLNSPFTRGRWFRLFRERGSIRYYRKPGHDKLIRIDFHGSREVPTGTCHAVLKAAGIRTGRKHD